MFKFGKVANYYDAKEKTKLLYPVPTKESQNTMILIPFLFITF